MRSAGNKSLQVDMRYSLGHSMSTALFICACAPALLILAWIHRQDRLAEPKKVVWITILLGGLVTIPIIVAELSLSWIFGVTDMAQLHSYGEVALTAFVIAAIVEEIGKFIVLWFYAARHSAFDEPMDGIVYGVSASLGFALVENVLYVFMDEQGFAIAIARALTAVPMHAICGVLMGSCIGIAKLKPTRRGVWLACGLFGAIACHGLYDFGAFGTQYANSIESNAGAAFGVLLLLATLLLGGLFAVLAIARFRRDQERAILSGAGDVELIPPQIQSAAPKLPMAALLMTSGGCVLFILFLILAVNLSNRQADGEQVAELENVIGGVFLIMVSVVLAAIALSITSLVRQPRWRAGSIVALVVSTLLVLMCISLVILGMLMNSETG